jgi:hypothetical protein
MLGVTVPAHGSVAIRAIRMCWVWAICARSASARYDEAGCHGASTLLPSFRSLCNLVRSLLSFFLDVFALVLAFMLFLPIMRF